MIKLDAFVNLRDVENGLRRMQLAGMDLRPVFKAARKDVRADQRDHAKQQEGPDGKWPRLDPDTLKKRTRQGAGRRHRGKMKRRRKKFGLMLGKLPRSFTISYSRSWIRGTARPKWSGAHQPKRGSTTRIGRGATLRARPYLWASTGLLQTVARKAVDYMTTQWVRK